MASISQLSSPKPAAPSEHVEELGTPVILRLYDAKTESYRGKILRVEKGFFQLSSSVWIDQNSKLEVIINDQTITVEVLSCQEHKPGDFRLSVRRTYGPQRALRSEVRIPVALDAVLKTSASETIRAKVIDMSQSGLGLETSSQLLVGTRVLVEFIAGTAFGEVRHCTAKALTYRAGIRIDEFVVRNARSSGGSQFQARPNESVSHRVTAGLRVFASRAVCSVAGHEYVWCEDAWTRPVLRCTRCHRDLDASSQ